MTNYGKFLILLMGKSVCVEIRLAGTEECKKVLKSEAKKRESQRQQVYFVCPDELVGKWMKDGNYETFAIRCDYISVIEHD